MELFTDDEKEYLANLRGDILKVQAIADRVDQQDREWRAKREAVGVQSGQDGGA